MNKTENQAIKPGRAAQRRSVGGGAFY